MTSTLYNGAPGVICTMRSPDGRVRSIHDPGRAATIAADLKGRKPRGNGQYPLPPEIDMLGKIGRRERLRG